MIDKGVLKIDLGLADNNQKVIRKFRDMKRSESKPKRIEMQWMYGPDWTWKRNEMKGNERIWKWKEMKAQAASHLSLANKDPLQNSTTLFSTPQLFGGGLLVTSPHYSSYIIRYLPSNNKTHLHIFWCSLVSP